MLPDVNNLARTQQSVMFDLCYILDHSLGADTGYNSRKSVYTERSAPTICGFKQTASAERVEGEETIDGELRLPLATQLTHRDRIRLTKRYGRTIDAVTFAIVGPAIPGPSAILVKLQRVSTNG